MHDSQVRDALLTYVDSEPPMAVRSDDILTAGRRARRVHRMTAGAAGGAVAGIVVLAAAAVTGVLPGQGAPLRPAAPSASAASPAPSASTAAPAPSAGTAAQGEPVAPCTARPGPRPAQTATPGETLQPELAAWARASLTCYLADALPRVLPDARYAAPDGAYAGALQAYSHDPPMGARVDAAALITDSEGTGDILVIVEAKTPAQFDAEVRTCRRPECVTRSGAGGSRIMIGETPPVSPGGYYDITVRAFRGHTAVVMEVTNSDRGPDPARMGRAKPALTVEQLVELASDPALTLFP
ncbi:MAG TPA: hypothetical protein VK453_28195 [Micromonosporaceae bacterium]|nr:hypothetical protein [Micromonosporaceae bacterium]